MRRTEPHSGLCNQCGLPVIAAHLTGTHQIIVLDPSPDIAGAYRAHLGIHEVWVAAPAITGEGFKGTRRRAHCVPGRAAGARQ